MCPTVVPDTVIAPHQLCEELLRSPYLRPVDVATHFAELGAASGRDLGSIVACARTVLFFMHGTEHLALRRVAMRFFRPSGIAAWSTVIDAEVRHAIDGLAGIADGVDLVRDLALPLTSHVMCRALGVPMAAREDADRWSDETRFITEPMQPLRRRVALNEALHRFHDVLDAADWTGPAGGPMPFLAAVRPLADGVGPIGREELIWTTIILHGAGRQTWHTLANVLLAWVALPPAERPRADESPAWHTAIDHLLRLNGSVQAVVRVATRDVDLGGCPAAAGEQVYLSLAAANRDPSRFGCPVTALDGPGSGAHLSFGAGLHRCVGMALARTLIERGLAAFARRYPHARPTDVPAQWSTTRIVSSAVSIPVDLGQPAIGPLPERPRRAPSTRPPTERSR